jgi:hypothetical protein
MVAGGSVRGLTFELSGSQRHGALAARRMIACAGASRPGRHAVGAPLERGVRPHRVGASTAIVMRETQVN